MIVSDINLYLWACVLSTYVWAKMAGVACLSAALTLSIIMTSNHISAHAKIYGKLCKFQVVKGIYLNFDCSSISALPFVL